jgi:hypothetical protein
MPFCLVQICTIRAHQSSLRAPDIQKILCIDPFRVVFINRNHQGGGPLARSNYSFKKRQKELARKKKKEEKRKNKLEKNAIVSEGEPGPSPDGDPAEGEMAQAEGTDEKE